MQRLDLRRQSTCSTCEQVDSLLRLFIRTQKVERRDILKAAAIVGLAATAQTAKANLLTPGTRPSPEPLESDGVEKAQNYIILETFFTTSNEKRDALAKKFDAELIPLRHEIGFEKVGVFTVNHDLMEGDRGYDAEKFDGAVFVVQETSSIELLLNYQDISAKTATKFNLDDDLDFVDEEIVALRAFPSVPSINVPNSNEGRVLQLRTYNSPNYERNIMKEAMFEDGELEIFLKSGMEPVFFGRSLFGSMAPNVTYMLSFESDEARREGWSKFVGSDEWKKMSADPKYERTATRIRNLFLNPTANSDI